jgi:hypothetical protein
MEEELIKESDFIDEIKDLHRLHLVTKDFKHIIEYEKGSWKMFEPSKFVYSYFAFNSFYNYDWQKSCEVNSLYSLDKISDDEEVKSVPEVKKMKKMINFIFENIVEEDKNEFIRFIKKPFKGEHPVPIEKLIESIEGITPDNRISDSERVEFKENFNQMITENKLQIGKLKNMARFVYLVRNNIFHGTKTTIEMSNKKQRDRLEIYANILIGVNELLFKSLEKLLCIKFDKEYKLKFNDRNQ